MCVFSVLITCVIFACKVPTQVNGLSFCSRILMEKWRDQLADVELVFQDNLSMNEYLSKPAQRLQWKENKLPEDQLCVENGTVFYQRCPSTHRERANPDFLVFLSTFAHIHKGRDNALLRRMFEMFYLCHPVSHTLPQLHGLQAFTAENVFLLPSACYMCIQSPLLTCACAHDILLRVSCLFWKHKCGTYFFFQLAYNGRCLHVLCCVR